jgi:hypothetical protein
MATILESELVARRRLRLSMTGIFAGLFVAFGIELLLTLLAAGFGLIGAGVRPIMGVYNFGYGIWFIVETCIATLCGAAVAGACCPPGRSSDGLLNGLASWGLFWVFFTFLLMNFRNLAGGQTLTGQAGAVSDNVQSLGRAGAWGALVAVALSGLFALLGGYLGLRSPEESRFERRTTVSTPTVETPA